MYINVIIFYKTFSLHSLHYLLEPNIKVSSVCQLLTVKFCNYKYFLVTTEINKKQTLEAVNSPKKNNTFLGTAIHYHSLNKLIINQECVAREEDNNELYSSLMVQ